MTDIKNQHLPAKLVVDQMRADNLRTWLELEALREGTENQRERYADRLLPEDELLALARTQMFASFVGLPRWATGKAREQMERNFPHASNCAGTAGPDRYDFETAEATELEGNEFAALKRVRAAVSIVQQHPWLTRSAGRVTVETVTHWVTCRHCKAEVCRSSAKVSIEWAGRVLVREYAL